MAAWMTTADIGRRVRRYRQEQHLSQELLARLAYQAGIPHAGDSWTFSVRWIKRLEQGQVQAISWHKLYAVAAALHVSLGALVLPDDDTEPAGPTP